jgi:Emfourin
MKIYFERSGGFIGIPISMTIDTSSLPTEEARIIQNLVEDSHFFELPPTPNKTSRTGAADYFQYQITIENSTRKHTVKSDDISIDPKLKLLINLLIKNLQKWKQKK